MSVHMKKLGMIVIHTRKEGRVITHSVQQVGHQIVNSPYGVYVRAHDVCT